MVEGVIGFGAELKSWAFRRANAEFLEETQVPVEEAGGYDRILAGIAEALVSTARPWRGWR